MPRARPRPHRPFTFETEGALAALGVTRRQFNVLADDQGQHYSATATVWALHLRFSSPPAAEDAALLILESRHEGLTGDCHAGDSWITWCEEFDSNTRDESAALHIYFVAPNPASASVVGRDLASMVEVADRTGLCISTGADWSDALESTSGRGAYR